MGPVKKIFGKLRPSRSLNNLDTIEEGNVPETASRRNGEQEATTSQAKTATPSVQPKTSIKTQRLYPVLDLKSESTSIPEPPRRMKRDTADNSSNSTEAVQTAENDEFVLAQDTSGAQDSSVTQARKVVEEEPSMAGSGKSMDFEKLRGRENYDIWKIAAKSYLILKNYWKIIDEDIGPELWPVTNAKAISEITLMIDPILYNYIKPTKSARAVWDGIAEAFDDSGTLRKVTILNQLVSVKLSSSESMEKYVNNILLLWNKSKVAGFQINEDIIASLMLGGLPSEYRSMILGIENSGKELTVDYIKTVLLQGIPDNVFHSESAFTAKINKKFKKRRKCFRCGDLYHIAVDCKKEVKCYHCGGYKHIAKNCNLRKKLEKTLNA